MMKWAHSWYPAACCSDKDCHVVPCGQLTFDGAWHWYSYVFEKVMPSPDGLCHVCVNSVGKGVCLFVNMTLG